MTHWTSIPFYLWKNTFKRWLENPFPALVKILIPALLAALGVTALAMFAQIERELEHQLKRTSALRVHVSDFVRADKVQSTALVHAADELMWTQRVGAENIRFSCQLLASARYVNPMDFRSMPVFSSSTSRDGDPADADALDPPEVKLLSKRAPQLGSETIVLGSMRVHATTGIIPEWVEMLSSAEQVVLVPEEMAYALKRGGYIQHMLVELPTIGEVAKFVSEVKAYGNAEKRQISVTSSLDILRQLERIQGIQNMVRRLLVAGCCLILAMTLGSIAWLEYRQDSYLLALLRSFGTPTWILFLHGMVENLLLVMLGICSVLACWKGVHEFILNRIDVIGFEVSGAPSLPTQDVLLIIMGGLLGVLLAMLPIAAGLRKAPGYTLQ